MRIRNRIAIFTVAVAAALPGVSAANHAGTGRPDCVSAVGVATASSHQITDFTTHGFGGGFIGALQLPAVEGVVPAPGPYEGDVVGALVSFEFPGVLGGGTTTVRPVAGLPGASIVYDGAQVFTAGLFTGHYKAEPRTYECESVVRLRSVVIHSFFEITLDGLLTPLAAGSPLSAYATGLNVTTAPGDNSPD